MSNIAALDVTGLAASPVRQAFTFPAGCDRDGKVLRRREKIEGAIEIEAEHLGDQLFKIRVRVFNTALPDEDQCNQP